MTAFKFNMPSGIAGDVSRAQHATVEAQLLDTTNYPTKYGVPVKIVSGKVCGYTTSDTMANTALHGWYVRPYPTNSAQDALGAQTIPTSGICNIMVRGYMMVYVAFNAASCAKDSAVYVRIANSTHSGAGYDLGQVEGAIDTADCILVTGAKFTGAADSQGFCEIAFNI